MLALPVHPRLARLLVAARHDGRIREGAAVAALLSERDIRLRDDAGGPGARPARQSAASGLSDILDRLDMLAEAEAMRFAPSLAIARHRSRARRVRSPCSATICSDAIDIARRGTSDEIDDRDDEAVLRWLLLAYPDRVVKRRGAERTGVMVGGRGVRLGPESVVA